MRQANLNFWSRITITFGIMATFIGTVVGAGFASGQEIMQFFSIYSWFGNLGIIIAVLLMGIITDKVFKIGIKLKSDSYQDLLTFLLGKRLVPIADLFLAIFFTLLIGVMFAGCGAIFEEMQLGYWSGIFFTVVVLFFTLYRELAGLISVNLLIIPLMFVSCLGIAIFALKTGTSSVPEMGSVKLTWLLASLQFSAYNLVLAVPVLLSLAKRYCFPKILHWGSWLGSLALGLMAAFIHWSLLAHYQVLNTSPLPMVVLAKMANQGVYWWYALVLWGEMLTTLLANTYGVAQRLVSLTGWSFRFWVFVLAVIGVMIAKIGFTNLIATFYPIYGYLSLILVVMILLKPVTIGNKIGE